MNDIIDLFVNILYKFDQADDYYKEKLETIAAENGQFAYIDDRRSYSNPLIENIKKVFEGDDRVSILEQIMKSKPNKVGAIISLFPQELQEKRWDKFCENIENLREKDRHKTLDLVCRKIVEILNRFLGDNDTPKDREVISSLTGLLKFKSESQMFPDFVFKTHYIDGIFTDGSILELKDSAGSGIASFNSTIPTHFKNLQEINDFNNSDIITKLAFIIDYPYSTRKEYLTHDRKCFYLVRTNRNNNRVKISVVEGSFFETLPKEKLIAETMKAIAREHLGKEFTFELEQVFERINDQNLIARSRSDIVGLVDGNEKKASVSPRFRIMSEVTNDGNPHQYREILDKTLNLILRVTPSRTRDEKYCEEKDRIVSAVKGYLEKVFRDNFYYDSEKEKITNDNIVLKLKEIEHRRNGIHLVFQFKY